MNRVLEWVLPAPQRAIAAGQSIRGGPAHDGTVNQDRAPPTRRQSGGAPDAARGDDQEAVGTGRVTDEGDRIKPEVKEGEKVLYAKYAGTEVKLEEEEYLILSEKDILAVLES